MRWFWSVLANSGSSPFVPPGPPCTHLWNGRRERGKDNDDYRPLEEEATEGRMLLDDEEATTTQIGWHKDGGGCGKKSGSGRRRRHVRADALSRIGAFLICTLLLIMIFFLLIDRTILDTTFAKLPPSTNSHRWFEFERICQTKGPQQQDGGPNSNTTCCYCTTVADIIDVEKNSAKRVLFFADDNITAHHPVGDFESEVALIKPQGMSIWDSDTRLWPVDHGRLLNEYVAAMALLPLVLGSLRTSQNHAAATDEGQQQRVLVVGLGGGSLDMFWHIRLPWVNITVYELEPTIVEMATKWFGAVNDQMRRSMLGDGLEAIERAVEEGDHFDTILVDACDHGPVMPCPSPQFLSHEALVAIRSALSPLGAFVLNVLPLGEEEEANVDAVQRKLTAVFPTCVRTRMAKQMNNIFACLPYAVDGLEETIKMWNAKMGQLTRELGLEELLANAQLAIGVDMRRQNPTQV